MNYPRCVAFFTRKTCVYYDLRETGAPRQRVKISYRLPLQQNLPQIFTCEGGRRCLSPSPVLSRDYIIYGFVWTLGLASCAARPASSEPASPASASAVTSNLSAPVPTSDTASAPTPVIVTATDRMSHRSPATDRAILTPTPVELAERYRRQQASVAAGHTNMAHPERLSPDFPPKPYDRKRYDADPNAYLDVVEPGRCWQTAAPDAAVPALTAPGGIEFAIPTESDRALVVAAPAGAPVTFTSFDMGTFANGLASITVQADAQGRAEAVYTATPGTVAGVRIVAGCPEARELVTFSVTVTPSIATSGESIPAPTPAPTLESAK